MNTVNASDEQKLAILDVINVLKTTFDIKDDDVIVQNEKFTDKEKNLIKREQEFQQLMSAKTQQLKLLQNEVKQKQNEITKQLDEINRKYEALQTQEKATLQRTDVIAALEQKLKNKEEQLISELERVTLITKKDAIASLYSKFENEAKLKAQTRISEIINEATQQAQSEAQKILTYTIQKESITAITNSSTTLIDLPNELLKGKIIGREGRNIKTFEELTGVTVLIDDTPEAIVLSCYDPIRREIAKIAMTKLIADGRIHPQRIEEIISQSTQQFEEELFVIGQQTAVDLKIVDLNNQILKTIGRLKFRTSYSQNVLDHSKEVALMASDIAAELKFDVKLLVRAGFLHDIGKALDRNITGTHAEIGANFLRQYGESEKICKLVAEHHDNEPSSILTYIIKTADTISSARPGARNDTADSYIKRLQDLENVVSSFNGVKSSYAVLAGRELRIIVEPEIVNDNNADIMASEIKDKIQQTMSYPGQIKVVVIRETRHTRTA